jgi:hypothetical protein
MGIQRFAKGVLGPDAVLRSSPEGVAAAFIEIDAREVALLYEKACQSL